MAENDFWEEQLRNWVEQSSNKNSARALPPKTMSEALNNRSKVKRMSLLPYPQLGADGSIDMTDWVAPQVAIDLIESAQLPGQVYRGEKAGTPEEARKMAVDVNFGSALLGKAPAGSLGMFAGRRAKTANLEKMKIAQKMLDDGVDRTDVWKQTGWMRGPDGKMRFEIDDSGSVANPINKKGQNYLPTALSHQGLYEAYPDLNRTSINLRGKTGLGSVYHPTPDNIKIGQFSGAGDLPPEIRHAKLQEVLTGINNEIKALNSRVGQKGLKQGSPEYIEYMALVDSFKKAQKSAGKTTGSKATPNKSVTLHETQHAIQEREGFAEGGGLGSSAKAKDEYRRLAGEAEARNVQTRMDYSQEQRLDEPPWTTLDVPEADQIVRGATDGPQMSLPMDEASRMARAGEMGFDADTPLYHGTSSDIAAFDPALRGDATAARTAKMATWMTDDPTTARGYAEHSALSAPVSRKIKEAGVAEDAGDWDLYDAKLIEAEKLEKQFSEQRLQGQNIMPVYAPKVGKDRTIWNRGDVDAEGLFVKNMKGKSFDDTGVSDDIQTILQGARRDGYAGVKFLNLDDAIGMGARPATHVAVFNPSDIRSKHAKFDPAKRNSADLLASNPGDPLSAAAALQKQYEDEQLLKFLETGA
jgi:hypothetical protein